MATIGDHGLDGGETETLDPQAAFEPAAEDVACVGQVMASADRDAGGWVGSFLAGGEGAWRPAVPIATAVAPLVAADLAVDVRLARLAIAMKSPPRTDATGLSK